MSKCVLLIVSLSCLLIAYLWNLKVVPNLPRPEEGVKYYYLCSGFTDRQLVNSDLSGPLLNPITLPEDETLFVLIPGYTESSFRKWINVTAKALLDARPSSCVVFVDHWNYLTFSRPYMTENVDIVAKDVAGFLLRLEGINKMNFSDLHVIGFSLGGWISGQISNHLPSGKKIARITGIDPSFPWQSTLDTRKFLDAEDADIVVAIRTSGVGLRTPPVGFDFYVDGGNVQKECDVWWHPHFVQQICSHYKAPLLFASQLLNKEPYSSCLCANRESLLNGSCGCDVRNTFGLNLNKNTKGSFFMESSMKYKFKPML